VEERRFQRRVKRRSEGRASAPESLPSLSRSPERSRGEVEEELLFLPARPRTPGCRCPMSRGVCETACPESSRRVGFHHSVPLRI
jgi:hypothetical protein